MPTPFAHLAVPILGRALLGPQRVPKPLLLAGAFAALVPDADVIGYWTGIEYESQLGHRGFTHSLAFALLLAAAWAFAKGRESRRLAFAFVFLCGASHGALDACTDGGLGVAFLSPWNDRRYFAPTRPIVVASIDPTKMLSEHGAEVLRSELLWIGIPTATIAGAAWALRRRRGRT